MAVLRKLNGKYLYESVINEAIVALTHDQLDHALKCANEAMNFALYIMREPVWSEPVKQAQTIRQTVFMLRRFDKAMNQLEN